MRHDCSLRVPAVSVVLTYFADGKRLIHAHLCVDKLTGGS